MKKIILTIAIAATFAACGGGNLTQSVQSVSVMSADLKFPESVLFNGQELLATNFGTAELNPLNTEGKGYVVALNDSSSKVFIAADGNMSAPKGTFIKKRKLYIADVGKLLIYSLDSLTAAPEIVTVPSGNEYLNDVAFKGDTVYFTETSTGCIFSFNTADSVSYLIPTTYIPGANGIIMNGNTAYVSSFPASGEATEDNVIYVIEDINKPSYTKLITRPGKYDGLAFSEDRSKLYFTNWDNGGEVGYVTLDTKEVTTLDLGDVKIAGPARLVQKDGVLYVPDLVGSKIYKIKL